MLPDPLNLFPSPIPALWTYPSCFFSVLTGNLHIGFARFCTAPILPIFISCEPSSFIDFWRTKDRTFRFPSLWTGLKKSFVSYCFCDFSRYCCSATRERSLVCNFTLPWDCIFSFFTTDPRLRSCSYPRFLPFLPPIFFDRNGICTPRRSFYAEQNFSKVLTT